eukprot:3734170-Prymnesium_polylepis.1
MSAVYPSSASTEPSVSSFCVRGPHIASYMAGTPQTSTIVSGDGGCANASTLARSIHPALATHAPSVSTGGAASPSGVSPITCTSLKRSGAVLAHASSSSRSSTSSQLLLPNMSVTSRSSPAVPISLSSAWYMGAIPVPPQSM